MGSLLVAQEGTALVALGFFPVAAKERQIAHQGAGGNVEPNRKGRYPTSPRPLQRGKGVAAPDPSLIPL